MRTKQEASRLAETTDRIINCILGYTKRLQIGERVARVLTSLQTKPTKYLIHVKHRKALSHQLERGAEIELRGWLFQPILEELPALLLTDAVERHEGSLDLLHLSVVARPIDQGELAKGGCVADGRKHIVYL